MELNIEKIIVFNKFGEIYLKQLNFQKAEEYFNRSLDSPRQYRRQLSIIKEDIAPRKDASHYPWGEEVADGWYGLGRVLASKENKDLPESIKCLKKALEIYGYNQGLNYRTQDHPNTTAVSNLLKELELQSTLQV